MFAENLRRDVRIGTRVLTKEKSFSLLAIVVLALGICGVTTMFSVVNGVMLRGFSFPNADRLVSVNFIDPSSATFFGVNGQIAQLDLQDMRPAQTSFELMADFLSGSTVNATVNGQPRRYTGAYIGAEFLRILGLSPILGRDFTAADDRPGAEPVALIGYGIWQRDFGGTPDVVGRSVRINGKPTTIVGVMAQGFAFPSNDELWLPISIEFPAKPRNDPTGVNGAVIALLKPGVSVDQANAETTAFAQRFASTYPDTNKQFNTGRVERLIKTFTPVQIRATLLTMLVFCVGVLLIACVNVMNMQFARATLRAKELAIRSSLGATRGQLIRQMLTESLLVSAFGSVIGVLLAYASVDRLSSAIRGLDTPPPAWITFVVDGPALAVTVIATLGAAVASGLLPAWMASRAKASVVLREAGRGTTSRSINLITRALVVFQIVVTCILLIGSLLQVRSILNQQTLDYHYDVDGLMSARMGLMDGDYPTAGARKLFFDRLVRELRAEPEFAAAALTNRLRMVFSGNAPIEIDGHRYATNRDRPIANFEQVTAGFFDVTSQKLLEGRAIADDDMDAKQPVAVVNAAFARKHFGAASAVGRRFRTVTNNGTQFGPWRTIIGVVSDVRMLGPFNNPGADDSGFYVPFYAPAVGPAVPTPFVNQFATVVVRPRPGQRAESLVAVLRRTVAKADPNLPLYFVGTPRSHMDAFVAQNRIIATMFTIFGIVAIVIASVGIYGVMSFAVNQRTQEFGVRMALGADYRRIISMVLRQGLAQVAIGLTAGVALAYALAMAGASGIQNILFGVSPRDPLSYGVVIAIVAIVSLTATFVPARRATRVDPMIALRAE